MRCPQCGYHSYEGLKRCKKCGALLSPLVLPVVKKIPSPAAGTDNAAGAVENSQVVSAVADKSKPIPRFLLERDHQASFFDQIEAEDDGASELDNTPPALWRRIAATVLDYVVLFEIWYAFVALAAWVVGQPVDLFIGQLATLLTVRICYYLLAITLVLSYFTLFHCCCGQTVGKMLFGVRVVTDEGEGLTLAQAVLRSTGGVLALLCGGYGYLSMVFDQQKRGWNDRMAGSMVVDATVERKDGSDEVC